jgi:hypothetical protein
MDALGLDAVPIEISEVGMSTGWVSESTRVRALGGMALSLPGSGLGVTRMLAFEWLGPDADPAKWDDWYGLVRRDGSLKPGGAAYLMAVRAATGSDAVAGSRNAAAVTPATRVAARKPAAKRARRSAPIRRKRRATRGRAAGRSRLAPTSRNVERRRGSERRRAILSSR